MNAFRPACRLRVFMFLSEHLYCPHGSESWNVRSGSLAVVTTCLNNVRFPIRTAIHLSGLHTLAAGKNVLSGCLFADKSRDQCNMQYELRTITTRTTTPSIASTICPIVNSPSRMGQKRRTLKCVPSIETSIFWIG